MAITGTKAFTSGEVLTANDVNQYLMRGVKVFSSTVVRDAAYGGAGEPTLEEGETCYITGTDELQTYNGSSWVKIGPVTTPNPDEIAIFTETQASGTVGGTGTAAAWTKRTLNTTQTNNISGCSIASSVITLAAGTYRLQASTQFRFVDIMRTRWRNTTDGTTTLLSLSEFQQQNSSQAFPIYMGGIFTIAATKNFEFQYYIGSTAAGNVTLGTPSSIGVDEVYSIVELQRIG